MATLSPGRVVKEKSEVGGGRFLTLLGDHQKPVRKDFSYSKDIAGRTLHIKKKIHRKINAEK